MEQTPMTRTTDSLIEILDANGRVIGTITRPVEPEALGPGREKVYLAKREGRPSQAA
jgi:hypothetical protein